eukprot:5066451-Prymnesium_polylepis.1
MESSYMYPTTTPPGRFGRPHRNDMGHAPSPLYMQAGLVVRSGIPQRYRSVSAEEAKIPRRYQSVSAEE